MSHIVKQAVILAGGRGERLRPFTNDAPKPLYPINGIPFINHLLNQVVSFGIRDVLLLLGYKAEMIQHALVDGSKFGLHVEYDVTPAQFDTAERICHANEKLDDAFLLMYCDNYCPIDFEKLCDDYQANHAWVQLSAYSNKDHYTKDNMALQGEKVVKYDKSRESMGLSGVDIGYAIVNKAVLTMIQDYKGFAEAYSTMADKGKLYATVTDHRYYSIGSYARIPFTEEFFHEKKAVFLDRDGTLNVRPPKACYVEAPDDFIWIPGAKEAVRLLNENKVITIMVTNQPGIARGNLTEKSLAAIHNKMQSDLRETGCEIDHIYYCPHDWDDGCDCRKPKPGMLYQAQRDLSLNLRECTLFGDDERDIEAGEAAGCKTVLIDEKYGLLKAVEDYLKEV